MLRGSFPLSAPSLSVFFICTTATDVAVGALAGHVKPVNGKLCATSGFLSDMTHMEIALPLIMTAFAVTLRGKSASGGGEEGPGGWATAAAGCSPKGVTSPQ